MTIPHILVVDDEADTVMTLAELLRSEVNQKGGGLLRPPT